MQERYEFKFHNKIEEVSDLSLASFSKSLLIRLSLLYFFISIVAFGCLVFFICDRFIKLETVLNLCLSFASVALAAAFMSSVTQKEMRKAPCYAGETHLILTKNNIQDAQDGLLTIVSYKHTLFPFPNACLPPLPSKTPSALSFNKILRTQSKCPPFLNASSVLVNLFAMPSRK
jgi:hypothetical protein